MEVSFPADGHEACFRVEDDSFWFTHRNACILAALKREGVGGPLVDVGGGNGVVSLALQRAGIETVLVEPGPAGAENARRRGLTNVICAPLDEAGLAPASFPSAGLFDVAEHVADDAALLADVRQILRQDGVLCVTVPAHAWLWSDEDELAGHHRRYTLRSLSDTLSATGFQVRYATYFFAPLTAPVFVLRSLRRRIGRRSVEVVAKGAERQHVTDALTRRAIQAALAPEVLWIRAGRRISVGTSCLAIARKT